MLVGEKCQWVFMSEDFFESDCGNAIAYDSACNYNHTSTEHLISCGVKYCCFCGREISC